MIKQVRHIISPFLSNALLVLLMLFVWQLKAQPISEFGQTQTELEQAKEWLQLSETELQKQNYTSSLRYGLQTLDYLERNPNDTLLYRTYVNIGAIYQSEKLFEKALEFYKKAAQLSKLDNSNMELRQKLANTHAAYGQIDSAAFHFNQLLKYHLKAKNNDQVISSYQDLVDLYNQARQYPKALEYNFKIMPLVEAMKDEKKIAIINNNIGYSYNALKLYTQSIKFLLRAAKMAKRNQSKNLGPIYTNIAISYQNNGNNAKALDYLANALENTPAENVQERLNIENLIAALYLYETDFYNALQHNEAITKSPKAKQYPELLSEGYLIAARIHEGLYEFEPALEYYQKHLELRDSLRLADLIRQQNLLQQKVLLERAEKEIKLLIVNQEVDKLKIDQLETQRQAFELEAQSRKSELALLRKEQEVERANTRNKSLEAERAKQELELTSQRLVSERQKTEIIELQRIEQEKELELARQRLALASQEAADKQKERAIEQLQNERKLDQLELEQDKKFRQFIYGFIGLLGLILAMILAGLLYFRKASLTLSKQNKQIEQQKSEIEEQRNQSDRLLLNILPEETAQELKEKGAATPKQYDLVTVLFSDFSGFTSISAKMSPEELIEELNTCFRAFDEIIDRYHLEKIKTIGDAYMCAGGIPIPNTSNPGDAVAAGLEMKAFMDQRIQEKAKAGKNYWKMRLGIHSGPCIAGVVGKRKFAYDIWGDTVNTASRIESNGNIDHINISEDTYKYIKNEYDCNYRGEIDVKNKGKIKMYFVEGKKSV